MVEIVPGWQCDAETRAVLARVVVAEHGHEYPQWTVTEAIDEIGAPGPIPMTFVAVENGRAIGCASLLDDDEVTGWDGHFWLGNVVVLGSERGRGVGSALVQAVMDHARSLGIGELHLVTTSAIDWYLPRGWARLGSADVHGHPMTVMRSLVT